MHSDKAADIARRLDAIIGLLVNVLPSPEDPRSLSEKIQLLDGAGLGPADVGRIVGRRTKDVTAELARLKRKGKGKRK